VIGVGTMGRNHVRVYTEFKDVDNVYLYDVDGAAARRMSEQYGEGVLVSDSITSLLDTVDLVSICAPTKYHFELARQAVGMGIHCLIEKPICSTSEEAAQLVQAIQDDVVVVGVGHIERFNPIVREIKQLINRPRYIEIKRLNPASTRITDADVVTDLMIHDIDLVWNYFMDGYSSYHLDSVWDEDLCTAIARFGDCAVSLSASRIACKKTRSIYVEDEDFSVEGDFMNQEVYIYRKPQKYSEVNSRYVQENIIEKVLVSKVEPLKEELKMFVRCAKDGAEFPVTAEQALFNLQITEEIRAKGRVQK